MKKAYNTVWREYAYTSLHDASIRRKLWRQVQAIHKGLKRSVRHPLGVTDTFDEERGVAQGARESPLLFAMFINGLAEALRARGLGVMLAGRRVPLFMYADDMIMLAATQNELAQMNAVASEYARQHRFQFSDGKSAVMAFGMKKADRARADARG